MSRTRHHGNNNHIGHDYGSRFRCNKGYCAGYGKSARNEAHREMRADARAIVYSAMKSTEVI